MHLKPKSNFAFSKKRFENDIFQILLGQLRSVGLRGSCGKISKIENLKSVPKWHLEGDWCISVNKSLWISKHNQIWLWISSNIQF